MSERTTARLAADLADDSTAAGRVEAYLDDTLPQEIGRICNRHIRRLMDDMEEAQCPRRWQGMARNEMRWLRQDVCKAVERAEGRAGE